METDNLDGDLGGVGNSGESDSHQVEDDRAEVGVDLNNHGEVTDEGGIVDGNGRGDSEVENRHEENLGRKLRSQKEPKEVDKVKDTAKVIFLLIFTIHISYLITQENKKTVEKDMKVIFMTAIFHRLILFNLL